jgi:uroporphyrinogen III methyltransferase / synthase
VVPGISSALAAPAYAGIPVTHRGMAESVLIITASGRDGRQPDWKAATAADSIVVLMGRERLADVCNSLMQAGKPPDTPAATIRWGTRHDQQVVTGPLNRLPALVDEACLAPPVVTVVGPAAALASEIAWFDPGPLAGKRVVVTRARDQASELADRLAALGALVVEAPVIKTIVRDSDQSFLDATAGEWDWVMYTSASAVRAHFAALRRLERDTRSLASARIGAIGDATAAELSRHGLLADFIPTRATAEQLAAECPITPGDRVFYPASALSDDAFAAKLRERGASVEQVAAYDTITQPLDAQMLREVAEAHAITFTSASTARNLRAALPEGTTLDAVKLVSIGPRTSDAVREAFGRVDREASTPSLDALVEATREVLQ